MYIPGKQISLKTYLFHTILCASILYSDVVSSKQSKSNSKGPDFLMNFDRYIIGYQDNTVVRENLTTRKFNRTTMVTNIDCLMLQPLNPGEVTSKITAYQFLSNTYRLTAIQFEIDYCAKLALGSFGSKEFKKISNWPDKCPVPPGRYFFKDGIIPSDPATYQVNTCPPNFLGKWKVAIDNKIKGKSYLIYEFYFTVTRVIRW